MSMFNSLTNGSPASACAYMANGALLCAAGNPRPGSSREGFATASMPFVPLNAIPFSKAVSCYPDSQQFPLPGEPDHGYIAIRQPPSRAREGIPQCSWRSSMLVRGNGSFAWTRDEIVSAYANITIAPYTYFEVTLYIIDKNVYRTVPMKFYTHSSRVTFDTRTEYTKFERVPYTMHAIVFGSVSVDKRPLMRTLGRTRQQMRNLPSDWTHIGSMDDFITAVANKVRGTGVTQ